MNYWSNSITRTSSPVLGTTWSVSRLRIGRSALDEFRALTSSDGYYEDFPPGRRIRHARGATIDEVENNYITKQVMNTAQGHWNEAITAGSEFGDGRVVFGLVTGSVVVGLCSQDTAERCFWPNSA